MVIIRNEERIQYLDSLEEAQLKGKMDLYYHLITLSVDRSLEAYINAASSKPILPAFEKNQPLNINLSEDLSPILNF